MQSRLTGRIFLQILSNNSNTKLQSKVPKVHFRTQIGIRKQIGDSQLLKIILIVSTIISFYIGMRRIFVFLKIEKYKKHYFYYICFGALFKFKVIRLVIAMKRNRDETLQIMIVKKGGKTSKIMNLAKMGRFDPDIAKILYPAVYVEKLDLEIKMGFEDAKDTCMFCGFIMAAVHALLPLIEDHIRMDQTVIKTTPVFKKEKITVLLDCILKIDLVNIIIRYFKVKKERTVLNNASNRNNYASDNE